MLKILSWNIAHRPELWSKLEGTKADVALLQEACEPSHIRPGLLDIDYDLPWETEGGKQRRWRTAIVGLNKKIKLTRIPARTISSARDGDLGVSRLGTLAAANVEDPDSMKTYTVVSMYAVWEKAHHSTKSGWIFADSSAHRLISDISCLVGQEKEHHLIVAGDLNILFGYGEFGNNYWKTRYGGIFDRFRSIGLDFVGPQHPNGRQAHPWPTELPPESRNVPTYHTNRQTPETATRQLDFVFASSHIARHVRATALNSACDWGGSDHCRIWIEVH